MPKPLEIFEEPEKYWNLMTSARDVDLEDQFFDRKEACAVDASGNVPKSQIVALLDHLKATVSALANENHEGGLLVLGISKTGEVRGLSHLTDEQRNSISQPSHWLLNQNSRVKFHECSDSTAKSAKICLIYTPFTAHAVCETISTSPSAWRRQGAQNALLSSDQKKQLRRDKRITSFEEEPCSPFDLVDVDEPLLAEFRKVFHSDARYTYSDVELLFQAGALIRDGNSYLFNNAGFLFFAANPQRLLPWAAVRLTRQETLSETSSLTHPS